MKQLLLVLTVIRSRETRSLVRIVLEDAGHRVVESGGCKQAVALLENGLQPDVVMLESPAGNMVVPEHAACARLVARERLCLIVGIGEEMLDGASFGAGAAHRLVRPVTREDVDSLISRFGGLTAGERSQDNSPETQQVAGRGREASALSPCVEELGEGRFFFAASPVMMEIHRQAKLLGEVDVNVLLQGESGTGKEIVARLIHQHSQRRQRRFVGVNCAALPADLLERELFGQKQVSYAGALHDRAGKCELADGGTLLLDEISELPLHTQAKLLHLLQHSAFTRLGSQETTRVDVRVLATANVQFEDALMKKVIREDLYYRLSAVTLQLPPLRERREEIPYLIEEFIRRIPEEMRTRGDAKIPSRLMDVAMLCEWRGNLRELRNFVVRTLIMRDADAAMRELEAKVASIADVSQASVPHHVTHHRIGLHSAVRDLRKQTEVQMVKEALNRCGWNRRKAADYLQISYRGLLYKIQQHQLAPEPGAALRADRRSQR